MKKSLLVFLMLWLGFMWNTSFANKVKIDDNTDNVNDCLLIKTSERNNDLKENWKKCSYDKIFINYYQHHLYFIKQIEFNHPYLKKDVLKYHKLFNQWLLELKENWNISIKTIKRIKKKRNNLYLKIQQYE